MVYGCRTPSDGAKWLMLHTWICHMLLVIGNLINYGNIGFGEGQAKPKICADPFDMIKLPQQADHH